MAHHFPPSDQQFERLSVLASQLLSSPPAALSPEVTAASPASSTSISKPTDPNSTLTVIDNRTGKKYEIPVKNNTIAAPDLRKITFNGTELLSYDPGFVNTAMATSRVCFIDGDKGILEYRGYPIEQLAEKSSFLEVAYLLIFGQLPTTSQLHQWNTKVMTHTYLHENMVQLMRNFRYDAHPMGMLISCISALSTFYSEANPALRGDAIYNSSRMRNKQLYRIIGKLPTIAAAAYRNRIGRPYNQPRSDLGYTENFLYMLDALGELNYRPHPGLVRALDIMFILHADHEMNCSTAAMRHIASSHVDPFSAVAGAGAALYGPLHGGANEAVLHMLEEIGGVENVPSFIEGVKAKKRRLMGFGHRVYHNYDPRAKLIQQTAYEVFKIVGREPLIDTAVALEKAALADEYFIQRKLYPNVDFYSGLIYKAMGFPTDMFPVLFMIPRAVGWLAHWIEALDDPEAKIARPRQVYAGASRRDYVPIDRRGGAPLSAPKLDAYSATIASSLVNVRRGVPS